jgi:hypothetical protein
MRANAAAVLRALAVSAEDAHDGTTWQRLLARDVLAALVATASGAGVRRTETHGTPEPPPMQARARARKHNERGFRRRLLRASSFASDSLRLLLRAGARAGRACGGAAVV